MAGLLLAAGSGRRYGQPKALVDTGSGPSVLRALAALRCCEVRLVVVGAAGEEVAALLPPGVLVIDNAGHAEGMGSSLRCGLLAMQPDCDAVVVLLVDLPGVGVAVTERLVLAAGSSASARSALLRASYGGVPGHPVLLGRDHWPGVIASAAGDAGARDYFRDTAPRLIECSDVGSGEDVDLPPG
ncbi:nucleotidyltransferase family protein [Nakamurella sp. GG22]